MAEAIIIGQAVLCAPWVLRELPPPGCLLTYAAVPLTGGGAAWPNRWHVDLRTPALGGPGPDAS